MYLTCDLSACLPTSTCQPCCKSAQLFSASQYGTPCPQLRVGKQRDKSELLFRWLLHEDSGPGETTNYVDFLCLIHKEIKQNLS